MSKINWKRKYDELKEEFNSYRFETAMTKENKVNAICSALEIIEKPSWGYFLWKLSHEDLDILMKHIKKINSSNKQEANNG